MTENLAYGFEDDSFHEVPGYGVESLYYSGGSGGRVYFRRQVQL